MECSHNRGGMEHTVRARPIRQSRVTVPSDETKFGRLSRVTVRSDEPDFVSQPRIGSNLEAPLRGARIMDGMSRLKVGPDELTNPVFWSRSHMGDEWVVLVQYI